MSRVLVILRPSAARRIAGLISLSAFGGILLSVAILRPPQSVIWTIFLLAIGVGAMMLVRAMYLATGRHLELTETELRENTGLVLARMDQILKVDRGTFAFKPSSGFRLVLKESAPRHWAPGLWWRIGRQVGIGGVTNSSQGKAMAETIAALLSERR